jgi:methyl-accepting chemotaxis protein
MFIACIKFSTTYIDEFTLPMQALQEEANLVTYSTIRIVIINLLVAILIVAFIAFTYGLKLINSIRILTDVTNRFSVGEMSASINLKAKDEIGDLAEAITRMQESIRWAFKRINSRQNPPSGK